MRHPPRHKEPDRCKADGGSINRVLNRTASAFPAACDGVGEGIIKKTAFLTVEDSLQLAAGFFNNRARGRDPALCGFCKCSHMFYRIRTGYGIKFRDNRR